MCIMSLEMTLASSLIDATCDYMCHKRCTWLRPEDKCTALSGAIIAFGTCAARLGFGALAAENAVEVGLTVLLGKVGGYDFRKACKEFAR